MVVLLPPWSCPATLDHHSLDTGRSGQKVLSAFACTSAHSLVPRHVYRLAFWQIVSSSRNLFQQGTLVDLEATSPTISSSR